MEQDFRVLDVVFHYLPETLKALGVSLQKEENLQVGDPPNSIIYKAENIDFYYTIFTKAGICEMTNLVDVTLRSDEHGLSFRSIVQFSDWVNSLQN